MKLPLKPQIGWLNVERPMRGPPPAQNTVVPGSRVVCFCKPSAEIMNRPFSSPMWLSFDLDTLAVLIHKKVRTSAHRSPDPVVFT